MVHKGGLGLIASCYDKVVIVWDRHLEITTNATTPLTILIYIGLSSLNLETF